MARFSRCCSRFFWFARRVHMGMTNDGLSYWQAERAGFSLLNTTMGNLLDLRAAQTPDKEAVVYSSYPEFGDLLDISWTYTDYCTQPMRSPGDCLAMGLQQGAHIAVWALNLPTWLLLQMAAAKTGQVLATVNPALYAPEVVYILRQDNVLALFFMARMCNHACLATVRSLLTPGAAHNVSSSRRLPCLHHACLLEASTGLLEQNAWRAMKIQPDGAHVQSCLPGHRALAAHPGSSA
jgi:hypothetical protein